MSKIKYNISLDMHSLVSQASLAAKQGDDNRQFAITLRSGGQPYKIERGAFAVFSTTLPDGKVIEDNCIIANDEIVYDFTQNLTSQIGVLDIEIRLYDANSKLITSPTFILVVSPRAAKAEDITSSNSYTALDNLYKDTSEAIQRADDAASFAISTARSIEEARDNGDFNGEDGEDVNYNLVSNALKGAASGAAVTLTDVSPLEHRILVKMTSDSITDFSTVKLKRYGKNILPYPYKESSKTLFGVQFTVNANGSIKLKGTAGKYCNIILNTDLELEDGVMYKLGGATKNTQMLLCYDEPDGTRKYAMSQLLWSNKYTLVFIYAQVNEGVTVDETIYPILYEGDYSDNPEWEPYVKPETYLANADGTVEVKPASPTTILTTDTEGVVLDVEYNRDANKVIDQLYSLVQGGSASRISHIDLPSANWKGTASPYSQVVAIDGITDFSKVDINPSIEQLAIFHTKDIAFVAENEDGVVTVYCIGQKPTANYTMQITITEVLTNG